MTRRLWALIRKELRTLFQSPIAYIVLTAFLVLNGVYFFQNLIQYNRELFVYGVRSFGGSIEGALSRSARLRAVALGDRARMLVAHPEPDRRGGQAPGLLRVRRPHARFERALPGGGDL
jgi:hypothetical protein